MNNKLTPWFPGNVKPARPGIYNVSCQTTEQSGKWYGRYNSDGWQGSWATNVDSDIIQPRSDGMVDTEGPASWRGLASNPKGAKK